MMPSCILYINSGSHFSGEYTQTLLPAPFIQPASVFAERPQGKTITQVSAQSIALKSHSKPSSARGCVSAFLYCSVVHFSQLRSILLQEKPAFECDRFLKSYTLCQRILRAPT